MLAKPELLVFCGLESGAARQPRNLGFVLVLSCRSLLFLERSHASSSEKLTNVASTFSVVAQRSPARHCRNQNLWRAWVWTVEVFKRVAPARSLSCHAPNEEEDIGKGRCQRKPCERQFVFSIEVHVEV